MICAGCDVREPWEHRCHGWPCACEECRAAACLMACEGIPDPEAAIPAMVEALREVSSILVHYQDDQQWVDLKSQVDAAVAKATGQDQQPAPTLCGLDVRRAGIRIGACALEIGHEGQCRPLVGARER